MPMFKNSGRPLLLPNIYFLNVKSCSHIMVTQVWIWSDVAENMRLRVFSNVVKLRDHRPWGFKFIDSVKHILLHRILNHTLVDLSSCCVNFNEIFFKPDRNDMGVFQILHTIDLHSKSLILANCLVNYSKNNLRREVFSFINYSNDA